MASMKDIKQRKSSIQSTQQITKAMKLVSTVKLQKARTRAENANPFFQHVYKTVSTILAKSENITHPYLKSGESDRIAVVVITSNRGLAGGYNSNIVKLITESGLPKDKIDIYAIGGKGRDSLAHKGYTVVSDDSPVMEAPTYTDAKEICDKVLDSFAKGEIGEIYLAYAHFKNTVVNVPTLMRLLPVEVDEADLQESKVEAPMGFEPNEEEVLDMVIPKYVTSLFYGALIDAVASENGARMQAMDSATSNAEEMISDLSLKYNRARQGAITQELTEIIAGAQAIS